MPTRLQALAYRVQFARHLAPRPGDKCHRFAFGRREGAVLDGLRQPRQRLRGRAGQALAVFLAYRPCQGVDLAVIELHSTLAELINAGIHPLKLAEEVPADGTDILALAAPEWKGRLCLRSSKKVYNQSLVATMIERLGAERTEKVVRGWVANLATAPFADDTLLAKAIAAGQCDVGIINTYYLGRLQHDDPGFPVQVFWANQNGVGAHVNVSGAGIVAASKQKDEARKFLEWLASESVQADFASVNFEIPARPGVALDPVVAAWGPFKADPVNVSVAGARQAEAVKLMDRAGWR